jgi:2-keto-3-deoxy-L-rhamnonate aldolase RhmA
MIIKKKLNEGKSLMGTMLETTETPAILRVLKECGYDFVFIDCEHSFYDHKHVFEFAQMGSAIDMGVIVRVPEVTRQSIQNFLDYGVDGIMIPFVETPEQMKKACELARYLPRGKRGITLGAVPSEPDKDLEYTGENRRQSR